MFNLFIQQKYNTTYAYAKYQTYLVYMYTYVCMYTYVYILGLAEYTKYIY